VYQAVLGDIITKHNQPVTRSSSAMSSSEEDLPEGPPPPPAAPPTLPHLQSLAKTRSAKVHVVSPQLTRLGCGTIPRQDICLKDAGVEEEHCMLERSTGAAGSVVKLHPIGGVFCGVFL
jgi:hypothetical protein